jgi:transcription elongation factor Elf1
MVKCPHCNELVSKVNLDAVECSGLRTILFSCPHCQKILNVQIDPIAIKTDIIAAIQNIYGNNR